MIVPLEKPMDEAAPLFWIPAFAGMTGKGQPWRPFALIGNSIETAAKISPPANAAPAPVIPAKAGIQRFWLPSPHNRAVPELWGGPGEGPPLRNHKPRVPSERRGYNRITPSGPVGTPPWLSFAAFPSHRLCNHSVGGVRERPASSDGECLLNAGCSRIVGRPRGGAAPTKAQNPHPREKRRAGRIYASPTARVATVS